MQSTRDNVIEGTARAERLLRDMGARGRGFGAMAQDLADRKILPKDMLHRALAAARIRDRVVDESATLQPVEIHQWTETISRLTDWLERHSGNEAPVKKTKPVKVRPPRAPRKASSLRLEPWMLVGALVPLVALAGAAWNFRADLARYPTQFIQSVTSGGHTSPAVSGNDAASAAVADTVPPRPKKHGHGSHVRPAQQPAHDDQSAAG